MKTTTKTSTKTLTIDLKGTQFADRYYHGKLIAKKMTDDEITMTPAVYDKYSNYESIYKIVTPINEIVIMYVAKDYIGYGYKKVVECVPVYRNGQSHISFQKTIASAVEMGLTDAIDYTF